MFFKYTRRFQNCIPDTGLVFLLRKNIKEKKAYIHICVLRYTNLIMVGH
jgi:hypothetical protein